MTVELTPEMARDYFAANLTSVVGIAGKFCGCPLAMALKANGAPNPRVSMATYYTNEQKPDSQRTLPAWAYQFIKCADWDEDGNPRFEVEITGAEALEYLERALKETASA